jgi:signal transduction histidine kinase
VSIESTWTALQGLVAQPTAFLERLVRAAIDTVGARIGGLVLVPPDGPYCRQIAAVNAPTPIVDARIERSEGLMPRLLQGRPVYVADYSAPRPPSLVHHLPPIGPVALWPFVRDGEVYAYLQAAAFAGDAPFDAGACARVAELVKRANPMLPSIVALRHCNRGLAVYDAAARLLEGLRRVQETAELARRAVDGLSASLGYGSGAVVLVTPDGGFENPGRPDPVEPGALERAAMEDGQLVLGPGRETCLGVDREVAVVPLSTGDAMLGAMVIAQRSVVGHFWPEELRWIERYAVRVAFAIQFLRDRAAQAARIDTYQRLLDGVRLISAEHELDEVLQRLVDVAVAACQARAGAVYMLDAAEGTLRRRTQAIAEGAAGVALPARTRPGDGVVGRAFAEGRTLRVRADAEVDPARPLTQPLPLIDARGRTVPPMPAAPSDDRPRGTPGARSDAAVVATPIRVGDERVGVLTLAGSARGPLFTVANLEHMELVAAHAGTAVAAARRIDALRHTEADLRRHVAEVEEYAHTVSHDLRTPVVSISGLSTVLLDEYADALPEGAREIVLRIRRAADHLSLLSGDLTTYSMLGREGEIPEAVSLLEMLDDALDRLVSRVSLVDMAFDLPTTDVRLWIVRTHLERIVDNALTNALRFAGRSDAPRLRISWTGDEVSLVLRFEDNGPGIPDAQRERVFELFRRGDPRTGGTGIGLSSVRRCAELAGGAAWIERSTLGGCALCVRLPRA